MKKKNLASRGNYFGVFDRIDHAHMKIWYVIDMVDKELCWVIFHWGKSFNVEGQKVMNSGSRHWLPRQYSILSTSAGVGFQILDPDYKKGKNHSMYLLYSGQFRLC